MADRCACGHEQDHGDGCPECLCPEWHETVQMIPTLMNGQWSLLLPSHRAYRREWTTPPYWEPERIEAMHALVRSGDVVWDVGAEESDMAGLWASWGADVALIEPNPKVWPNMKAIWQANDFRPPLLTFVGFAGDDSTVREGAGDWPAPLHFRQWPACADGPIIGDHGFLVLPERPDCPATTIDLLSGFTAPPTVITIDVEGAELTVLRGADRVLREERPAVFVSIHLDLPFIDEKYPGDTGERVEEFMAERGYVGRHLATDHEMHVEYRHPAGR